MLLLAAPAPSPWRMAYVARYYFPVGDRRVSHHQVYLADLRGGHRRQVTFGTTDCFHVRWLDHRTIAWQREDGTLWRLDVERGAPRLWRRFPASPYPDFGTRGIWFNDPRHPLFGLDRPLRYREGRFFPAEPTHEGDDAQFEAGAGSDVAYGEGTFTVRSRSKTVATMRDSASDFGVPSTAFAGPGRDDLWVVYWTTCSTWGSSHELVRYDLRDGRIRWRRGEIHDIDFRPDRALYARVDHRDVGPLGKIGVWTAALHVGDWKTGEEWNPLRGVVYAESLSLRP